MSISSHGIDDTHAPRHFKLATPPPQECESSTRDTIFSGPAVSEYRATLIRANIISPSNESRNAENTNSAMEDEQYVTSSKNNIRSPIDECNDVESSVMMITEAECDPGPPTAESNIPSHSNETHNAWASNTLNTDVEKNPTTPTHRPSEATWTNNISSNESRNAKKQALEVDTNAQFAGPHMGENEDPTQSDSSMLSSSLQQRPNTSDETSRTLVRTSECSDLTNAETSSTLHVNDNGTANENPQQGEGDSSPDSTVSTSFTGSDFQGVTNALATLEETCRTKDDESDGHLANGDRGNGYLANGWPTHERLVNGFVSGTANGKFSNQHKHEVINTPLHDPDEHVHIDFSHINEKEVLKKMDHRILPILFFLYMLCYLNRGSIGNAKIQGLTEDLHMSGLKYNNCLMVYFFTYCAFMVPSNLLLKKFRPSRWLPIIMICSGITMALTGLIEGYKSLLIARLFSGIAESGVYSGITYYITMWYCRHECQYRQAIVFSATGAAGAFSGLLAFAIGSMDGYVGLHGWQWIFVIEGMGVVILAILSFFFIHDFPSTASFLTPEERAWALYRLKYQNYHGTGRNVPEADCFHWDFVKAAYKDWHVWVGVLMFWGIICPLYGLSLFLPSILKRLGHSPATANVLTIPIYLTAAILTVATAWYSDKFPVQKGRARFIFVPQCFILAGFTIALIGAAMGNMQKVVYAGMFIATCGTLPAFPGNITWLSNNLSGSYKRSAGMAIQIGVGNMGGIFVSNFYREGDAPKYMLGHALQIGVVVVGMVAVIVLRVGYAKANKERDEMGVDRSLSLSQMSQMGDHAPTFRYYL